MVEGDVAPIGRVAGVSRGLLGHEPGHRDRDEPLQGGEPDPVGEPGDLVVHEPGRLPRQGHGGLGDPAGPPRGQVPGLDPGPEARQAVLQLERRGDQCTSGVGGGPERGSELGDAELRHQRRPLTGQRDPGLGATTGTPGRPPDRSTPEGAARPRSPPRPGCRPAPGRPRHAGGATKPSTPAGLSKPCSVTVPVIDMSPSKHRPLTVPLPRILHCGGGTAFALFRSLRATTPSGAGRSAALRSTRGPPMSAFAARPTRTPGPRGGRRGCRPVRLLPCESRSLVTRCGSESRGLGQRTGSREEGGRCSRSISPGTRCASRSTSRIDSLSGR